MSCTPCLLGIQATPIKEHINSTNMKPEKENVSLTPMEHPLKGDKEENFLEAAISTTFHDFDEENEVIRVGGRLARSPYTIDWKFPVVFPRKLAITEMLIREAHERNLHGGIQLTLYTLRQTIWILGGLSTERCLTQMQTMYPFRCQMIAASDGSATSRTSSAVICVQSLWTRLLWNVLHKSWNSNAFENIRC